MNSYYMLLVVLFGINSCVVVNNLREVQNNISREPLDYSFQVSKDNLTCAYNDKLIHCSDVPYLLDRSDYKYDRQLFHPHLFKKHTYSVLPKVRIQRPTFSLKGRLDRPDKFYNIPQIVTQPYYINRSTRKKNNNNLFPLNHKHHYYDSTISLPTMKNAIEQSKNNLILREKATVDTTTGRFAAVNFIEDKISNDFFFDRFKQSFERFDSKFYQATFIKLRATSPSNRNENAISFVQSGLLLYIALMAISTEVDITTKLEIDACLMDPSSVMEKIKLLKHVIAWLPVSNNHLKIRWASRLALEEGLQVSQGFVGGIANWSKLHVEQFNSTDTKDNVFDTLNHMVETDSGGAMSDTFIEDDFSEGFCSVFINTLYIRARWRVAPTVLNDTYPFKDGTGPVRSVQMIKLNDMMGYTELMEWDAEAVEMKYALPGLTLLMVVPRGNSIRNLIHYMKTTTPQEISNKMHNVRVAATLPIYTLRMTLLLPGKLQMMNISRLMDAKLGNNNKCGELRLSHAVQRLMFWAEAGRYAFKDDGIEWDEAPDVELMADRPYLFYVRWKNVTLMNAWLPVSNNHLKIRWASRLALEEGLQVSQGFVGGIANWSKLHVEQFNSTDTKDNVFDTLNHMVETDSGGAMSDTFIEDDFSEGFCSVFINTLYIRARWRVAPTVLNDTYPFKDGTGPVRSVQMIKLNDMMGYTELMEWDAEAVEMKYALPGLTLLMVVPRGNSIRNLIHYMKTTTPQEISNKMHNVRVAATLPIYTLRMTLLLPGKLQMMNISRLIDAKLGNNNKCGELRLSHAVQRLMFWAEAGRYAFKDDGIEWDEAPDVELMADRPYLFYVRWKNVTLMNGNFVL